MSCVIEIMVRGLNYLFWGIGIVDMFIEMGLLA
jgi:hypothetical protein